MTLPLLMLSPNGSRDRNGVVNPIINGAVRTIPFDGTNAWFVEEGTTNLIKNPIAVNPIQMNNGTANNWHTTTVWSIDCPDGAEGSWQSTFTGQNQDEGISFAATVINATTYTASFWVKGTSGSVLHPSFRITYSDSSRSIAYVGGTSTSGSMAGLGPVTLTGGWQYITLNPVTSDVSKTISSASLFVGNYPSAPGPYPVQVFNVWHPQIEAKAYATTFCPQFSSGGSLLSGYTWTGTPHNSTSTRALAQIYTPIATTNISVQQGSMYARAYMDASGGFVSGSGYLWSIGQFSADSFVSAVRNATGLQALVRQANATSFSSILPVTQGQTVSIYQDWTPTTTSIRANGASNSGSRTTPTIWNATNLAVGYTGSQSWNGRIAVMLFYPQPLTTQEIAKLDATPTERLTQWGLLQPSVGGMLKTTSVEPIGVVRTAFDSINPPS